LRRQQVRAICSQISHQNAPAVLMGDLNEWSTRGGALRAFDHHQWEVLRCGRSFPSRGPLAQLDRIVHSRHWSCDGAGVHHSALAAVASDHLPVRAALTLAA
jgi:endonuclease/exonuclease/phosphatase family metal-dependent hydrolase